MCIIIAQVLIIFNKMAVVEVGQVMVVGTEEEMAVSLLL